MKKTSILKTLGLSFVVILLISLTGNNNAHAQKRYKVKKNAKVVVVKNKSHKKVVVRKPKPAKLVYVNTLPTNVVTVRHKGYKYFVHNNTYYRKVNGRYMIVTKPTGITTVRRF